MQSSLSGQILTTVNEMNRLYFTGSMSGRMIQLLLLGNDQFRSPGDIACNFIFWSEI